MTDGPLRIGLAGLGTVGGGVLSILANRPDALEDRAGRPIELRAVSARDRSKDRGVDLSNVDWLDDPVSLARRSDIDLVVEAIGGPDGPAKACAEAALDRGAGLVTANKALLAAHGVDLAARAEAAGAALRFEAAVAGGVPIVKALGEGLAANAIERVYGVLNGTSNFILTEMERTGGSYPDILAQAQELGYAEADPTADVGGFDAGHKISLLASIAFAAPVDLDGVAIEGVERVSLQDIQFARELGYRIKQIALAERSSKGLLQRVAPCLLPAESAVGALNGVDNAILCQGDAVGVTVFQGPGAGAGPTASAIVADIIDIARGDARPAFGAPVARLEALPRVDPGDVRRAYYLRLTLIDQPGALAQIASVLSDEGVSIDQMRQLARKPEAATVLIVTHEVADRALRAAVETISGLGVSLAEPVALRIERA